MDEIGEIIRRVLFFRKITTSDFAEHIGISRKTLENVIHRNIKKKEIIDKIATGLGIDLNKYINKSPDYTLSKNQIDPRIYEKAAHIVLKTIINKNISCPKDELEILTEALYEFLLENKQASDEIVNVFCQGMIKHALMNFMLTHKSN